MPRQYGGKLRLARGEGARSPTHPTGSRRARRGRRWGEREWLTWEEKGREVCASLTVVLSPDCHMLDRNSEFGVKNQIEVLSIKYITALAVEGLPGDGGITAPSIDGVQLARWDTTSTQR